MSIHEVYSLSADSISLLFSSGELKTKEMDSSLGYGVRAFDKGRLGFAYCQKSDDLKKTVEEAKKMSRFSVQSGFSFPPSSSYPKSDISDSSLSTDDYQSLRGFVDEARDGAEALGGKARVMLSVSRSHVSLENTEGFRGEYDKTDFSLYIECMHDDGYGSGYLGLCKRPSLLLAERGLKPEFKPLPDPRKLAEHDAVLIIGDPAIDFQRAPHEHEIFDLGTAWYEFTKLPFVYAVWALQRGIENRELRRRVHEAKDFGLDTLDHIISKPHGIRPRFPQGLPRLEHPLPPRLGREARHREIRRAAPQTRPGAGV